MKYNNLLCKVVISSFVLSSLFFMSNKVEASNSNEETIQAQEQIIQSSFKKKNQLLEKKQVTESKQKELLIEIDTSKGILEETQAQLDMLEKWSPLVTLSINNSEKQQPEKALLNELPLPEVNTNLSFIQEKKNQLNIMEEQRSEFLKEKTVIDTAQQELDQEIAQLTQVVNESKEKKETLQKATTQQIDMKTTIVDAAKSHLGKPYVYGAAGPDAFDCSGLVQVAFTAAGRSIGRTTVAQEAVGTTISVSEAQAGDIVFWGSAGGTYHVGISLGDATYIHAPVPGDVVQITSVATYSPDFAVRV